MPNQPIASTSTQNLAIPPEIRTFLESILEEAHVTKIDEKLYDGMIAELFARLDSFMLTRIADSLPTPQLEEFTKLAESGKNRTELDNYLRSHIPNAQEVFTRAMLEFRETYLGHINK